MTGRFGGWYSWGLSPWWQSYRAFFRDVLDLHLGGDLWDRTRKAEAVASAGYWWPFADFVMVCDNPTDLHIETAGGQTRMHCETGPAIRWADGWGIHMWHGTQVPGDLIEHGWSVERILREENAEIRRCAVEVMAGRDGWGEIIAKAGWSQVGEAVPDPGNPGQTITLWHVPAEGDTGGGVGLYPRAVRLLVCTNGSVDRDGRRRQFGLTVPATTENPVAAGAWGYDDPSHPLRVTEQEYAQLARRC